MRFQILSEFVGSIYDTVTDASACPAMLNGLADLLGATNGAQVGTYNARTRLATLLAPRLDPEELPAFSEYWAKVWQRCPEHPVGAVIVRSEPQGAEAVMGTTLSTEGPVSTVVSVSRPSSEGDFDPAEARLFAGLIPHLQRAVQLRWRLSGLDGPPTSSAEMLDRLPHAVLLVDARAGVIFANQTAARMLGAGDGLSLGRDGLRAETLADTRRLRQTIADSAEPANGPGGAGGRLRLCRAERGPLTVLVVPHRTRLTWTDVLRPTAILFITDPEQATATRGEWLRQDYGLTPAEALFAVEISRGDGLLAAAGRLGVSLTTVRTHLAHVFDKTGARRQAELVRLILQRQPAA